VFLLYKVICCLFFCASHALMNAVPVRDMLQIAVSYFCFFDISRQLQASVTNSDTYVTIIFASCAACCLCLDDD
jgi:hypothetical protein